MRTVINNIHIKRLLVVIFTLLLFTVSKQPVYSASKTAELKAPDNVILSQEDEKSLKITWSKVKGADGYEVYKLRQALGGYRRVKRLKKTSWVTKIGAKRIATYKVRAYKIVKGKRKYSEFSYTVAAKTCGKKDKKINATRVKIWGRASRRHEYGLWEEGEERDILHRRVYPSTEEDNKKDALRGKLRWFSTDTSIATVDEKGIIHAKDKVGECYVYARAHNGIKSNLYKVKVKDYAYEKVDIQYAKGEIQVLFNMFEKDIRDIASYYAKNRSEKEWWIAYGTDYKVSEYAPNDEMMDVLKRIVKDSPYITKIDVWYGGIEFEITTDAVIAHLMYQPDKITEVPSSYIELSEHWFCDYIYKV